MNLKIFLLFFVICAFYEVNLVFGAHSQGNFSHPDYPGKCYIDSDEIYTPGKHKRRDVCESITCHPSGWVNFFSCGSKAFSNKYGPCETGDIVDATIPYPDCCQFYFRCKDENGEEYLEIH